MTTFKNGNESGHESAGRGWPLFVSTTLDRIGASDAGLENKKTTPRSFMGEDHQGRNIDQYSSGIIGGGHQAGEGGGQGAGRGRRASIPEIIPTRNPLPSLEIWPLFQWNNQARFQGFQGRYSIGILIGI
jgi:hypothetical protein